ncbi:response regulator, partial [Aegicerativicinus sediminis]
MLDKVKRTKAAKTILLITAWGSIPLAVEGLKAGASDFVTKPWSNDHLIRSIDTILSLPAARREEAGPRTPPSRAELETR